MNVNTSILYIGISVTFLMGLVVYLRNRKSATNILFFLFNIDIVLWSIANHLAFQTRDILSVLYWTRIVMALAVPQAMIFFLLIHTLPSDKIRLPIRLLVPYVILGISTVVICVGPWLFPSLIYVNNTPSPTPGPAMPLFILVAVGSVIAGIVTLIRKVIAARGIVRMQLQIMIIGIICMFAFILFFNFILVVVFSNSTYVSISSLYTLPFIAATGYAIIKHKFFDIRPILARTVSYTILISGIGISYALLFSLASALFVTNAMDPRFVVISTSAALLMLISFPFLQRVVTKATDSIFYKYFYDPQDVLFTLTEIMARSLRFEDLTHQLLQTLNKQLGITKSCIILFNQDRVFSIVLEGFTSSPEIPEEAILKIGTNNTMLVREQEQTEGNKLLDELSMEAVIPLVTSQRHIGILCVGEKLSGDVYGKDDLTVLEILAPEAAVAIENSLSYEEIRRFNITLEEEVTQATEDLRHANTKLEQLDKMKDEFVSLASHELRTPLTAIRSYLWMALSGKGGPINEKQEYYLDRAFKSANRLIKLVNDMLNISRIESGRLSLHLERIDVGLLIHDVVAEVKPKIAEGQLHLEISSLQQVPAVIADIDKIKEVLINIIGNAIKFTPPNGTISITCHQDPQYVTLAITDTGIGLKKDDIPKLFTKFSTIPNQTMNPGNTFLSTGLGLYLSKSIIEMHSGTLTASSEGEGKGSTFSFNLPIYTEELLKTIQKKYETQGLELIPTQLDT